MSRTVRARLLMAVLGWGVTAAWAAAGEPPVEWPAKAPARTPAYTGEVPPGYTTTTPHGPTRYPVPLPGPGYYPRTPSGARELPPGYPPVDSTPSRTPVRDWRENGRPLGCWGTFNGYGCSSLKSTLGFIFGSCRTFYGEPCLKGAPPSPLPPWAGPESGYHGHGLRGEAGRQSLHGNGAVLKSAGCPSCQ